MAPSTVNQLLAKVDPLPYKQRQRTLALQAWELAAAGQLDRVLEELSALGWYGRQLALTMAVVVRHTAHVEREVADPGPPARARALAAARRVPVSDEAFETVLEDAPAALRQAVYRAVAAGRRSRSPTGSSRTSATGGVTVRHARSRGLRRRPRGPSSPHAGMSDMAISLAQDPPSAEEHLIEHGFGEAPGRSILLAYMV